MSDNDEYFDWVVVGAGAAGLASVLSLTGRLPGLDPAPGSILLIDQGSVGHGSSLHNEGRVHGGFHYPDLATAESLQDELAYNLQHYADRFVPHFRRDRDGSIRRDWYALLPDKSTSGAGPKSILPSDESHSHFSHLVARWDRLKREQPALEALGTGPFGQWIEPDRAADALGTAQYENVATTLEAGLDVPKFITALGWEALSDPRVELREHDRMLGLRRLGERRGPRFALDTIVDGRLRTIASRHVNISAWEATEDLLAPLGYQFNTLNRIKRVFNLRLATASIGFPTIIALYGSHAMIRNFGDGTALATIGDLSNVNTRRLEHVEQQLHTLIANRHDEDATVLAQKAVEALARYFPALQVEEVEDIQYGCVKIFSDKGVIDLNDPHSDHNHRAVHGYGHRMEPGLFVTWSMKLVSCFAAAEEFRRQVDLEEEGTSAFA